MAAKAGDGARGFFRRKSGRTNLRGGFSHQAKRVAVFRWTLTRSSIAVVPPRLFNHTHSMVSALTNRTGCPVFPGRAAPIDIPPPSYVSDTYCRRFTPRH